MFPRQRLLHALLLTSSLLFTLPSALAQPGFDGGMPPPPGGALQMMPGMPGLPLPPPLRGLNLSEAQEDQIFSLMHAMAPKLHERAKLARKAREELHKLSLASEFDENRVKQVANASATAEAEMAVIRVYIDQQINALLTPEQRQQLSRFHEGPRQPHPPFARGAQMEGGR